eukprot:m.1003786 g.1003786  ORF g.1003786 m.1003786 type:complete len:1467 (-) comp24046_c1_seq11:2026-6426(-)
MGLATESSDVPLQSATELDQESRDESAISSTPADTVVEGRLVDPKSPIVARNSIQDETPPGEVFLIPDQSTESNNNSEHGIQPHSTKGTTFVERDVKSSNTDWGKTSTNDTERSAKPSDPSENDGAHVQNENEPDGFNAMSAKRETETEGCHEIYSSKNSFDGEPLSTTVAALVDTDICQPFTPSIAPTDKGSMHSSDQSISVSDNVLERTEQSPHDHTKSRSDVGLSPDTQATNAVTPVLSATKKQVQQQSSDPVSSSANGNGDILQESSMHDAPGLITGGPPFGAAATVNNMGEEATDATAPLDPNDTDYNAGQNCSDFNTHNINDLPEHIDSTCSVEIDVGSSACDLPAVLAPGDDMEHRSAEDTSVGSATHESSDHVADEYSGEDVSIPTVYPTRRISGTVRVVASTVDSPDDFHNLHQRNDSEQHDFAYSASPPVPAKTRGDSGDTFNQNIPYGTTMESSAHNRTDVLESDDWEHNNVSQFSQPTTQVDVDNSVSGSTGSIAPQRSDGHQSEQNYDYHGSTPHVVYAGDSHHGYAFGHDPATYTDSVADGGHDSRKFPTTSLQMDTLDGAAHRLEEMHFASASENLHNSLNALVAMETSDNTSVSVDGSHEEYDAAYRHEEYPVSDAGDPPAKTFSNNDDGGSVQHTLGNSVVRSGFNDTDNGSHPTNDQHDGVDNGHSTGHTEPLESHPQPFQYPQPTQYGYNPAPFQYQPTPYAYQPIPYEYQPVPLHTSQHVYQPGRESPVLYSHAPPPHAGVGVAMVQDAAARESSDAELATRLLLNHQSASPDGADGAANNTIPPTPGASPRLRDGSTQPRNPGMALKSTNKVATNAHGATVDNEESARGVADSTDRLHTPPVPRHVDTSDEGLESPTELESPAPSEQGTPDVHDTGRDTGRRGMHGHGADRLEMLYGYDRLSHGSSVLSDAAATDEKTDTKSAGADNDDDHDREDDDDYDDVVWQDSADEDAARESARASPGGSPKDGDQDSSETARPSPAETTRAPDAAAMHVARHRRAGSFVVNDVGNLQPAPRAPQDATPAPTVRAKPKETASPGKKPQRRVSVVAATGDAFWPSGHRRIAYDGGIIPDPTAWRGAPTQGDGKHQHQARQKSGTMQRQYSRSPSTAASSGRNVDKMSLSQSLPKRSKNSYLHQHRNRSSYERTSMAVNLCKVFKSNPEFHPDSVNDVTADARKLAKQLGVNFEPGPSDEEEFLRYKYVHDYVWSDADDPEKLATSHPSTVHTHVQQRRQDRGAWRLPLAYPEAGSPVTRNEVNLRHVLPPIAALDGDDAPSHSTGAGRRRSRGPPRGRGEAIVAAERSRRFLGDDAQVIMAEIAMLESDLYLTGAGEHRTRDRPPPQPPRALPGVGVAGRGRGGGRSRRPPEMLGGETGVPIYAVRPPLTVPPPHKPSRHKPQWHVSYTSCVHCKYFASLWVCSFPCWSALRVLHDARSTHATIWMLMHMQR